MMSKRPFSEIEKLLQRQRLLRALAHLPRARQFAIITSYIPIEQLEKIVKFQER